MAKISLLRIVVVVVLVSCVIAIYLSMKKYFSCNNIGPMRIYAA
jgi:hypothetical protein